MRIQTAGEQKYYDCIEQKAKSLRTGMIIWISLLALAFIASLSDIRVGLPLAAAGALLALRNLRGQDRLRKKLAGIADRDAFYNQLIAPDAAELPKCGLLITRDYVLSFRKDVELYFLGDLEKAELRGGQLVLTERSGKEHVIPGCSGKEETGRAYREVSRRLELRRENSRAGGTPEMPPS